MLSSERYECRKMKDAIRDDERSIITQTVSQSECMIYAAIQHERFREMESDKWMIAEDSGSYVTVKEMR